MEIYRDPWYNIKNRLARGGNGMNKYFAWFGMQGTFVLTVLMSAFALVLAIIFPDKSRWFCLAAMIFSSFGDLVLTNFRNISYKLPFPSIYLGVVLFAIAHVFYTCGYLRLAKGLDGTFWNPGAFVALAIVILCAAYVLISGIRNGNRQWMLILVCLVYAFVIGVNCVTVFSFSWNVRSWRSIAALGALSFYLSDILIGLEMISRIHKNWIQEGIWWLYPVGQILLILCG